MIDKKCVSCGDTYKYQPESEKIVADAFFIHSTGDQCATCICIGTPMDDATTEVSLANGIEQVKRYLGYTLDGPQTQEEGSIYQVDLTGEVTVSEIVHANGIPAFEVSVPGTYQGRPYNMGAVLFKGLNGVDSKEVAKAVVVSKLASNNWKVRKEK